MTCCFHTSIDAKSKVSQIFAKNHPPGEKITKNLILGYKTPPMQYLVISYGTVGFELRSSQVAKKGHEMQGPSPKSPHYS